MRVHFLVLAFLGVGAAAAHAETADPNFWVTNGTVLAMTQVDGTLYLGGNFTEVGPASGAGVILDASGATLSGFPKVVGRVFTVVGDLAGGWYIGGLFSSVGGQPRTNLARINADLSVAAWSPACDGAVLAIAPGTTGTVYVGGDFTSAGGQARLRLAEITGAGAATAWNPGGVSSLVRTLVATSGSLYVGGDFTVIGATNRNRLAQISTSTGALGTWNPNCNGDVLTMRVVARPGPTVSFLVGGTFTSVGGQARSNLAEITTAGAATSWAPNPNGTVRDIIEHTNVYVAGDFTSIAGFPRNHVGAVTTTSGAATAWNPNADDVVNALQWSVSQITLGGRFTQVGGQVRKHLARVDDATGALTPFDPAPNAEVKTVAPGNPGTYAGGEFTGLAGIERRNLAAFDVTTGTPKAWNPGADAPVSALEVRTVAEDEWTIFAAGSFTTIGGQVHNRIAELDPFTGTPTAWNGGVDDGPVLSLALADTVLYAGGSFFSVQGSPIHFAAAFDVRTGAVQANWIPNPGGDVYALAVSGSVVVLGGDFQSLGNFSRHNLGSVLRSNGTATFFDANVSGVVRAMEPTGQGSLLYIGGDFGSVAGLPRNHLAEVSVSSTNGVSTFAPDPNGIVRCFLRRGNEMVVGGDFTTMAGVPRQRIASFDTPSKTLLPFSAAIPDREVFALETAEGRVFAGGTFRGVADLPQATIAAIGDRQPPACPFTSWTTFAGQGPRGVTTGDFDNDGIRDLVVCDTKYPFEARILGGVGSGGQGSGQFSLRQILPLGLRPTAAVVADFDADGFEDLAIAQSYGGGQVNFYRSMAGVFGTPTKIPMAGRIDGIAAADMDQDGILDLVVAQRDSAGITSIGGPVLIKGNGTIGVWNGTFAPPIRVLVGGTSFARSVLLQDFNLDGNLDIAYGPGGIYMIWFGPGGTVLCENPFGNPTLRPGGHASGDMNEDGVPDVVYGGGSRIAVRVRNGSMDPNCTGTPWFVTTAGYAGSASPQDLAVLDFDQDGHLDVVYTVDSLGVVELRPGLGDGTLGPIQQIAQMDAWGITVGDFVGDGRPDVVITQKNCGTVSVLTYPGAPLLGGGLQLVTPNGGEVWQSVFPSLAPDGAVAPSTPLGEGVAPATPREIANAQQVSWTKGPGVQGVDVSVSRNGGATWQPIATNVPGSAMTWRPTPAPSSNTRIRVTDAVVRSRTDESDASFQITAGTVGVEGDLPTRVAFAVAGGNPFAGLTRFRLELPVAVDVDVQALDVRGRVVRTVARGRLPAGRHELSWNALDDRGAAARTGVYFVRARIGEFTDVRKVVLVH